MNKEIRLNYNLLNCVYNKGTLNLPVMHSFLLRLPYGLFYIVDTLKGCRATLHTKNVLVLQTAVPYCGVIDDSI